MDTIHWRFDIKTSLILIGSSSFLKKASNLCAICCWDILFIWLHSLYLCNLSKTCFSISIFLAFYFNFFLLTLCRVLTLVSKETCPGNRVTTSSWSGLLTSDWLASSSSPNTLRHWFYYMQWYLVLGFNFDFFTWRTSSGSLLFLVFVLLVSFLYF